MRHEISCALCKKPIDAKHMFCSKDCAFVAVQRLAEKFGTQAALKLSATMYAVCPEGLYEGEREDMQKFKEGKLDNSFFEIAGESHMDNDEAFMRPLGVPETPTPKVVKPSKATYYTSIDDLIESAR